MLEALRAAEPVLDAEGMTVTYHTAAFRRVPKSIPRGKPMAWYLEKYRYYAGKAADARDVYWSLQDAEETRAWAAMSREDRVAQLRAIGAQIVTIEEMLQRYRAACPAWDRELAEHGLITTPADQVWAWMHAQRNPHAMVKTQEGALHDAQGRRDWWLAQLPRRS